MIFDSENFFPLSISAMRRAISRFQAGDSCFSRYRAAAIAAR